MPRSRTLNVVTAVHFLPRITVKPKRQGRRGRPNRGFLPGSAVAWGPGLPRAPAAQEAPGGAQAQGRAGLGKAHTQSPRYHSVVPPKSPLGSCWLLSLPPPLHSQGHGPVWKMVCSPCCAGGHCRGVGGSCGRWAGSLACSLGDEAFLVPQAWGRGCQRRVWSRDAPTGCARPLVTRPSLPAVQQEALVALKATGLCVLSESRPCGGLDTARWLVRGSDVRVPVLLPIPRAGTGFAGGKSPHRPSRPQQNRGRGRAPGDRPELRGPCEKGRWSRRPPLWPAELQARGSSRACRAGTAEPGAILGVGAPWT